jgi:hypothetical protein
MAKVKVKMNSAGARALLNSPEVQKELLRRAELIRSRAEASGASFDADVQPGKNRAHAMVKTTDIKSRRSNAKHNTLLKALDAGAG